MGQDVPGRARHPERPETAPMNTMHALLFLVRHQAYSLGGGTWGETVDVCRYKPT